MLLGIIVLIVAVILIINNTGIIDSIQTRISNFSADNEELVDEESSESSGDNEESVVETTIEDGDYDEENKVTWHVEEDGSMCPIPDGYVGSQVEGEDSISTGYVIYEGTDEVTDGNVTTAKISRNQYVWIPVEDPSELYGIDENGKKWGKLYSFSTTSGITARNWTESSSGIISISSNTGTREPDVLTSGSYDSDNYLQSYLSILGISSRHEFLIQLEEEFNNMIESVEKYGGFYIGRYETGNVSQDIAVEVQGNTDIVYTTWYNSYKLCKTLKGNNENIETGLIWGCQWDRTLIWLIESGNKTIAEITDSRTWGNYSNSTGNAATGSGSRRSTGYSEYWKASNIYDLAGNVSEWTMEANSTNCRANIAGDYYSGGSSSTYPVSYKGYFNPTFNTGAGRLSSNALYKMIF